MIYETVVTTRSPEGQVHVAPMGVRYQADHVVLMPFRPSTTLANIEATGCAVLNLLTDVRVFAGCVTGRRGWPTVALDKDHVPFPGARLATALGHVPLRLVAQSDDAERPVLQLQRGAAVQHGHFPGLNRAQAAVVEAAVLVSRLHLLPPDKVEREFAYLQIAVDKTAGPDELEAWGWLQQAVQQHRLTPPAPTLHEARP